MRRQFYEKGNIAAVLSYICVFDGWLFQRQAGSVGIGERREVQLKMWAHQGQPKEVDFYKKGLTSLTKNTKVKLM